MSTSEIIDTIAATVGQFANGRRQHVRTPYPGPIGVATVKPPTEDEIRVYESRTALNISPGGIAFFSPTLIDSSLVIIRLNKQDAPIHIISKIVRSSEVVVDGQKQYLIGCQFLRRVEAASKQVGKFR